MTARVVARVVYDGCDYIPVISTVTGTIKVLGGLTLTVGAVAYSAIAFIAFQFDERSHYFNYFPVSCWLSIVGLGVALRGATSAIPILGNIICAADDLVGAETGVLISARRLANL